MKWFFKMALLSAFLPACSVYSPPDTGPVRPVAEPDCAVLFRAGMTLVEIATAADLMRTDCGMDEEETVTQTRKVFSN